MVLIVGWLLDCYFVGIFGGVGLVFLCVGLLLMIFMLVVFIVWEISWCMLFCGMGFGFFQLFNFKVLMISVLLYCSGGVFGIVVIVWLLGQSVGVVLVVLCFNLLEIQGLCFVFGFGVVFVGVVCIVSFLCLFISNFYVLLLKK